MDAGLTVDLVHGWSIVWMASVEPFVQRPHMGYTWVCAGLLVVERQQTEARAEGRRCWERER